MNISQINNLKVEVESNISKVSFASIIQETSPRMNKTNNPFFGKVTKRTTATIMLGNNYGNAVNNRINKNVQSGQSNGEGTNVPFVAEAPKGREWLKGFENLILVGNTQNTQGKLYLRTYHNLAKSNTVSEFYLDGVKMNEKDIEAMQEFMPKASYSKKQASFGLDEKDQVQVRDIILDNVCELKFANFLFQK